MPTTLTLDELTITSPLLDAQGVIIAQRTSQVHFFAEDLGNGLKLELVEVPAGSFQMGARPGQGYEDEYPQHRVNVAAFWMARYPITQAQWQVLMGKPLTRFPGPQHSKDTVSWKDAVKFCEKLSARTNHAYTLPSEAQWEYACRANTQTPFAFGPTLTTQLANYNGEFPFEAGPKGVYRHVLLDVGAFPPNAFGLHDLHGNLWEWCADPWHDTYAGAPTDARVWTHKGQSPYRVARGGCWHDTPNECRSSARLKLSESEGDEQVGFRVVLASSPLQ